ncbi:MAG: hypothetical protein ABUS57_04330 [Pseudomonadota bacterium]
MSDLKPLLVPSELKDALAAEAVEKGVSLEAVAAEAIEDHLEAEKARKFFEERAQSADPEWLIGFLNREGGEAPGPDDQLPSGYKPTR